jgi:hypothetical protein
MTKWTKRWRRRICFFCIAGKHLLCNRPDCMCRQLHSPDVPVQMLNRQAPAPGGAVAN